MYIIHASNHVDTFTQAITSIHSRQQSRRHTLLFSPLSPLTAHAPLPRSRHRCRQCRRRCPRCYGARCRGCSQGQSVTSSHNSKRTPPAPGRPPCRRVGRCGHTSANYHNHHHVFPLKASTLFVVSARAVSSKPMCSGSSLPSLYLCGCAVPINLGP